MKAPPVSRRATSDFCCEHLCENLMPSGRAKKVCQDIFLIVGTIVILAICAVPTAIYFSITVKGKVLLFFRLLYVMCISSLT